MSLRSGSDIPLESDLLLLRLIEFQHQSICALRNLLLVIGRGRKKSSISATQ